LFRERRGRSAYAISRHETRRPGTAASDQVDKQQGAIVIAKRAPHDGGDVVGRADSVTSPPDGAAPRSQLDDLRADRASLALPRRYHAGLVALRFAGASEVPLFGTAMKPWVEAMALAYPLRAVDR